MQEATVTKDNVIALLRLGLRRELSVRSRTEHADVFSGDLLRTVKCELLVASAGAGILGDSDRDLAAVGGHVPDRR